MNHSVLHLLECCHFLSIYRIGCVPHVSQECQPESLVKGRFGATQQRNRHSRDNEHDSNNVDAV